MRRFAIAAALMPCAGSQAVNAAETQKAVPAKLDPARAYLLVRMGERTANLWNTLTIAAYDDKVQDLRGIGRAKANPVAKTEDRIAVFGPKGHLTEQDHVRTYLMTVTPGRYVITSGPTTCFCLGSYQFDAAAGMILDMGTLYIGPENGSSTWKALAGLRSSPDIEQRGYTVPEAMAIYPVTTAMAVPPGLEAFPRFKANYAPARRFGNHSGLLLNRVIPMEAAK
jgi:hypothetical protein